MEPRQIIIVKSTTQTKHVITSSATTLGELKRDLRSNNIEYGDLLFTEGISKTELLTDESILPKDLEYKGKRTNDLIFLLTIPFKKIASGSYSRIEILQKVREANLQDTLKSKYNKPYTNISSKILLQELPQNSTSTTNSIDTITENLDILQKELEAQKISFKETIEDFLDTQKDLIHKEEKKKESIQEPLEIAIECKHLIEQLIRNLNTEKAPNHIEKSGIENLKLEEILKIFK